MESRSGSQQTCEIRMVMRFQTKVYAIYAKGKVERFCTHHKNAAWLAFYVFIQIFQGFSVLAVKIYPLHAP